MNLVQLGWNDFFQADFVTRFSDEWTVGRVIGQGKNVYKLITNSGDAHGKLSGKFQYDTMDQADLPVVGDWVVLRQTDGDPLAIIQGVLNRKSVFSRNAPGDNVEEQVIAANIDTVFLVNALNNDFNVRRIERYLTLVWESGANPVIILTKADLCTDADEKLREVEDIAIGVPIHLTSSVTNQGIGDIKHYFTEGQTIGLLGSSGVGKSTLTNILLGHDQQSVNTIRQDDKGRHTTTSRDLILLEKGMIIDTPGMRELQLWSSDEGLSQTFQDIKDLEMACKFRDCTHDREPGCAVKGAIEDGTLRSDRYESYLKLNREIEYLTNSTAYIKNKEHKMKQYRHQASKNRQLKKRN
ncbi:ribosome small subunit-dependent GTPase A [Lentibacillus saliphilus]|uniref:ribosome small subunit-dependent GTPase A n=1 Tax=Lentibacillus saliphilus TaxID=2737028 RepID=UPI001C2F5830|nr:ribosome small subunit-dependent GTPase A [Lentibacillus saliphilus]